MLHTEYLTTKQLDWVYLSVRLSWVVVCCRLTEKDFLDVTFRTLNIWIIAARAQSYKTIFLRSSWHIFWKIYLMPKSSRIFLDCFWLSIKSVWKPEINVLQFVRIRITTCNREMSWIRTQYHDRSDLKYLDWKGESLSRAVKADNSTSRGHILDSRKSQKLVAVCAMVVVG